MSPHSNDPAAVAVPNAASPAVLDRLSDAVASRPAVWRLVFFADPWLTALVLVLLAVRTLYLVSFPFLVEGDGYTYYHLLQEPHSSLIHASGYCLLFWPAKLVAVGLGCSTGDVLRIVQPVVSVVAVVVLYVGLRRVLRRWFAAAIGLLIGVDLLQLTAAGTSRPEFFEADLIMVLIALVLLASTTHEVRAKRRLYAGAGFVFATAFVTKFNCLPCGALLLAPLFDGDLAWRERWRVLVRGLAMALATLVIFVVGFHWPTTRSHHLNLEHGWIHMQKLGLAGIPLVPENGLATRKYLALVHALPPIGAGPSQWRKIDAVPPAERAPFRQRFGALLTTRDDTVVESALAPFRAKLRPAGDYHDPNVFCCIYHHLGLVETEDLLAEVYAEGKRARSGDYWRHVAQIVVDGLCYRGAYNPYLPMPAGAASFYRLADRGLFDQRARVVEAVDESIMKDADWAADFWRPGAELLQGVALARLCPEVVVWTAIGMGLLCGVWLARRDRRHRPTAAVLPLLLLAVLGMIAFSALVFVFRQKELIATHPLMLVAASLGSRNMLLAVRELGRRSPV